MEPDYIKSFLLNQLQTSSEWVNFLRFFILLLFVFGFGWLLHFLAHKILLASVGKLVKRTKTLWDDVFLEKRTFGWLSHLLPTFFVYLLIDYLLLDYPQYNEFAHHLVNAFLAFIGIATLASIINAAQHILQESPSFKDKPIASYAQLAKIFLYILGTILVLSILLNKSPIYFLSAMGALSAVVLLIFKDTILGFVASIHISANDMVRVGDWITVSKYGADGDVSEINLSTVKVRNFDKTITTVPTYALVSDSFKNWRGMEESDGRRIKRSLFIDTETIRFLSWDEVQKLKKIKIIKAYLEYKERELVEHNKAIDPEKQHEINTRRLTNIGTFRRYIENYLKNHPKLNQDMTCMVRQLEVTENGLPLEIYAFSKDKSWVNFEGIIGDIFDHVLTVASYFDLQLYQNPSGADIRETLNLLTDKQQ